ncbi:DUF1033 family protein [Sporosarcina highlanderae]|uniref:DUF1033 family protein n=1 Tax=Sporosarcina highlanderae TaxID=3035916 RepID=A0ABT8JR51_9BACL|nr:DUF1033 family protein [Sporosarcina highlanderae]MDN4607626.1 DUF1033 family protein [Sporosarcina highlanderae]
MVFEIIYLKADYEPWWMFEDWESMIQSRKTFETAQDAIVYLDELKNEFEAKYKYKEERKSCFFAYWSEAERIFCEGCDEDLQIFHGIISLVDGKPFPLAPINNSNI